GIGRAPARRRRQEGRTVVVVDRDAAAGERVATELGGRFLAADVGSPDDWTRVVQATAAAEGGLDVVHLNAGVTTGEGDLERLTDEQYRRIMGANVDGVVFGMRAVLPLLRKGGGGAIVATASLAGLIAFPPDPIYDLTKHAVIGLVRSVAPAVAAHGITVNAVCPGIVDTPLVGDEAKAFLRQAAFPLIPPEDIAEAVFVAATGAETG